MRRSQLFTLAFGFALICYTAAFPPWVSVYEPTGLDTYHKSRRFLWHPQKSDYNKVEGGQLFAEITVIASVTGLIVAGLGMTSIRSE